MGFTTLEVRPPASTAAFRCLRVGALVSHAKGSRTAFSGPADSDFDHFLDKCLFMAEGLAATKLSPWRNRRHFFLVHEQEHLPAWAAIQFFAGLSVACVFPAILGNFDRFPL